MDEPRRRSRSPSRRAPKSNRGGGFRWKDNRSNDNGDDRREYRDRGYDRGNDRRDDRRDDCRDDRRNDHRLSNRDNDRRHDRPRHDRDRDDRHRDDRDRNNVDRSGKKSKDNSERPPRKDKTALAPVLAGPGQEMIIVNINDRLGTKSAIPCLLSDTIGQLKLMVAARIGREAGQIMLKRQGERPFKDQLSLEDYGISNGVQLDLEVDTGGD